MISVFPANKGRSFSIDYENNEEIIFAPISASYAVYDDEGAEVVASTSLDLSGSPRQALVELTEANNDIGQNSRAFRRLVLTYSDDLNEFEKEISFILESTGVVKMGENSFGTYGAMILLAQNIVRLDAFHEASITEQRAALINAWYNIGDVPITGLNLDAEYGTRDLTSELLGQISASNLDRLRRAQIIEADFILGGNPVEDRRRTGMISDSASESAQFFRTSKPLELPVCKAAANALRGLVNWNIKVSR